MLQVFRLPLYFIFENPHSECWLVLALNCMIVAMTILISMEETRNSFHICFSIRNKELLAYLKTNK